MDLPKRVTLELTNRCNRACKDCPRHKMTYPLGDMSLTLLTKVTSQLPRNVCVVAFFRGEPMLHPQFPEAMSILGGYENVQLASNGDYLTTQNQIAVLRTCSFFSLSLHEFLMPWQTKHLSFLYALGGHGIETQVSILENQIPENKKKRFIREWQKHVDRVRIYPIHSQNGFGSMQGVSCNLACNKPFEDMIVYWDGNVGLCCHDWGNQTPLGDLNTQSISEIWGNGEYGTVRNLHLSGKRKLVASCAACSFIPNYKHGELVYANGAT